MTGSIKLEVMAPGGKVSPWATNAPRLDTLKNKTICEVWNGLSQESVWPLLRELLQKKISGLKYIPYTEFPHKYPDPDTIPGEVKKRGCDAAIVGIGV